MKKKILITGGQGFLGGRLVSYFLNSNDYEVTVTSRTNISKFDSIPVSILKVDTKKDDLTNILKGFNTVIHLAALDANACLEKPFEAIDVNITDTLRWRIAAEEAEVSKFIYISTIHVYGNQEVKILDELSPTLPHHPYAITHLCAEQYVLAPNYNKKSKASVFRLSNSFGYPDTEISQWHLVVLDFCKQAVKNHSITIKSNSFQERDFIPISSICVSIESFINENCEAGIYNLSSGKNNTLIDIANLIQQIILKKFGIEIEIIEESKRSLKSSPILSNAKLTKTICPSEKAFYEELNLLVDYCFNKFSQV